MQRPPVWHNTNTDMNYFTALSGIYKVKNKILIDLHVDLICISLSKYTFLMPLARFEIKTTI